MGTQDRIASRHACFRLYITVAMLTIAVAALMSQEIMPVKEWTRAGHAFYIPTGAKAGKCFINVFPAVDFKGTAAECHERVRAEMTRKMGGSSEDRARTLGRSLLSRRRRKRMASSGGSLYLPPSGRSGGARCGRSPVRRRSIQRIRPPPTR